MAAIHQAIRSISVDATIGAAAGAVSAGVFAGLYSSVIPENHVSLAVVSAFALAGYSATKFGPIAVNAWNNFKDKVTEISNSRPTMSTVAASIALGTGVAYGLSSIPAIFSPLISAGTGAVAGVLAAYAGADQIAAPGVAAARPNQPAPAAQRQNQPAPRGVIPDFISNRGPQFTVDLMGIPAFDATVPHQAFAHLRGVLLAVNQGQQIWDNAISTDNQGAVQAVRLGTPNSQRTPDYVMTQILWSKFDSDPAARQTLLRMSDAQINACSYPEVDDLPAILRFLKGIFIAQRRP